MVAKDDKIVVVAGSSYVSTSKDGARTFAKYTKTLTTVQDLAVAPNGELLLVGRGIPEGMLTGIYSTDDGATWKRAANHTEQAAAGAGNTLIVADPGYTADNRMVYICNGDEGEDGLLRWNFSDDTLEFWEDFDGPGNPIGAGDICYGMGWHSDVLYVLYSDGVDSGFANTLNPDGSLVFWGGEEVDSAADITFDTEPQALVISGGSSKLWAVNTSGDPDEVYNYVDTIGALTAPELVAPEDGYSITLDAYLETINPLTLQWSQVHKTAEYEVRIGQDEALRVGATTLQATDLTMAYTNNRGESVIIQSPDDYPFESGKTYYWKVRVSAPVLGPWSETRSLVVEKGEPIIAEAPTVTVPPIEIPPITVPPVEIPPIEIPPAEAPPTPGYIWVITLLVQFW
jgi:hypothetical protein